MKQKIFNSIPFELINQSIDQTEIQISDSNENQQADKIKEQSPDQIELQKENQLEIQEANQNDDPHNLGLSIIPVSSKKIPFASWTEFQTRIAPFEDWHSHYIKQGTVGIITGKVSGNLECIDIDVKNDPTGEIMNEFINLMPPELFLRLIGQGTPSGGFHLIYRCPETIIEGSQKLAKHSDGHIIIETKGEGGYFCTSSINNTIIRGRFNLATLNIDIPIITGEERNLLFELARSLNRYFPSNSGKTSFGQNAGNSNKRESFSGTSKSFVYSDPAINEFNNKFDILPLFLKHGWSVVKEEDEKIYLKREGSFAPHSGYYFKSTKTFFCFSTSTEFKNEKPYNHFQILQTLEGKEDYKTTVRLLPSYGFAVESKNEKVTVEGIAEYLNHSGVKYDTFIQDLTQDGKIIEEIDYNTIFINLKKHFEKEIPRTKFEEIIKSHYVSKINPIQDFIDKNIDRQPLGTFEQWLDCIVLKNKSINKSTVIHFLMKWYVGMIGQALGGEYPNEFFLTLLSVEQGIGKTTFLRNFTLPKELQCYRKEHSLSFDDDFMVLMSQSLLIVDDEMDGRTYETDKTFKTVLSTMELSLRRKYDRRISTIKRRCSFAGSGNNLAVVREQHNRRVIPIEIEKMYFDKLAEIDLTNLFMEAYHLYVSGYKYSYQREDMELLKQLHEDYQQQSDVDLLIDEYIIHPETIGDIFYISNLDIVIALSNKYPQFNKRINIPTIGKLMNERGFVTVRKGERRTTCYQISGKSKIMDLLGMGSLSWQ